MTPQRKLIDRVYDREERSMGMTVGGHIRAEYDLVRRRVMRLGFYCAKYSDTIYVSLDDVLALLRELRK